MKLFFDEFEQRKLTSIMYKKTNCKGQQSCFLPWNAIAMIIKTVLRDSVSHMVVTGGGFLKT